MINWWVLDGLSRGQAADATVVFAVDVCFLIVYLVFTYGFGFFSSLLMAFLVDIDVLDIARIARHLGGGDWLGPVVGICTVAFGGHLAVDGVRAAHQSCRGAGRVRIPGPGVSATGKLLTSDEPGGAGPGPAPRWPYFFDQNAGSAALVSADT